MSEEVKNEVKMPDVHELMLSSSPHLHDTQNVPQIMTLVLLSLMPATFAGMYFFGVKAIMVVLYCIVFSVGFEMLWCKFAGKPLSTVKDMSAVLTGLLLALNLSAWCPWWVCLIGAFLAIWLGKQVFGGLGNNPFNPALVARVGLLIALPKYMTTWVPTRWMGENPGLAYNKMFFTKDAVSTLMSNADAFDSVTCATPLGLVGTTEKIVNGGDAAVKLFGDVANNTAYWNYFIGNVGGCIGETSALALLVGGIFLLCAKLIKWQVPVAYIGTVALISGIIHAVAPGVTPPALFHVLTGGLLLGAIFMATDMVTSPMTKTGAFVFGVGCGVITCVIRIWGNYPEGVSFSILFMNALVPLIDRFCGKKPFGYAKPEKKGAQA